MAVNPTKGYGAALVKYLPMFNYINSSLVIWIMKFNNAGTAAPTYETTSLAFGTGFIEVIKLLMRLLLLLLYYCNECVKQLGFKDKKNVYLVFLVGSM